MSEIVEMDKLCDSLQTALLMELKNDDLEEFKRILLRFGIKEYCTPGCACKDAININHLYHIPECKTLLDIACSSANKATFVKCLLEHGTNVNLINPYCGDAPIHLAVKNLDYDTVKLLVEHKDIDIYRPNTAGLTAFHLAAQCKRKDFTELLMERQKVEIEQTKRKVFDCKPKLERNKYIIHSETNSLQTLKRNESSKSDESLSSLLRNRNYEAFKAKANANNVKLIDDALGPTNMYLQYACEYGLIEFVELLLDLNVDPNQVGKNNVPPIMLAAYQGRHDIVQLLQNTGIISYRPCHGGNILHTIMSGYLKLGNYEAHGRVQLGLINSDNGSKRDHVKCLKLILNNVPDIQLDVDMVDSLGNTPLFYAILSDNRDMILSLIERGADVCKRTSYDREIIQYMSPATLEYILDKSMSIITPSTAEHFHRENMSPGTPNRHFEEVVFNYNWLKFQIQPENYHRIHITGLLKTLSEVSELRPLLKHPFFLILLDWRWHDKIKTLLCFNMAVYILFVIFLSFYLLIVCPVVSENPKMLARLCIAFFWYGVFIGNSVILLKEFAQLIIYSKINKYMYVSDPQNYMEITLIIIVYVILFGKIQSIHMRDILASIAILFSYVELILVILNHPTMSIQIEMFRVVASNAFKVLMSYMILILAFAFTFFLLLKDIELEDKSDKSFGKIYKVIFKMLIMSTGDYEITNILDKDHNYGISHLVFILFIFFIPIVLFNLLNAVAVRDIHEIRKKAELVSTAAWVKLIVHMENVIYASSLPERLSNFTTYFIHILMRISLLRHDNRDDMQDRPYSFGFYFYIPWIESRQIVYTAQFRKCYIIKDNCRVDLKFIVSPFTESSIREKLFPETSKEKKAEAHHKNTNVAQENATLQEVCKSLITLKNSLEKTDEKYQIVEQILTEITNLSNQKSQ